MLGISLAVSDYERVISWMQEMVRAGARGYLTAAAVNLVMSAREDPATRAAVHGATLAVPDGQPLVWALRALGHRGATRIYGPELMARFCARAAASGTPMYLYGGRTPEALELLRAQLLQALPRARDRRRLLASVPRADGLPSRTRSPRRSTRPAPRSCGWASASPSRSAGWR